MWIKEIGDNVFCGGNLEGFLGGSRESNKMVRKIFFIIKFKRGRF